MLYITLYRYSTDAESDDDSYMNMVVYHLSITPVAKR